MKIKMYRETWENLVWLTESATLWVREKINGVEWEWALRNLNREHKHGKKASKRALHWADRTSDTNLKLDKARHAMEPRTRAQFQRLLDGVRANISLHNEMIAYRMYHHHRDSVPDGDFVLESTMNDLDRLYEEEKKYERGMRRLEGKLMCGACGAENDVCDLYCRKCGQPLEKE